MKRHQSFTLMVFTASLASLACTVEGSDSTGSAERDVIIEEAIQSASFALEDYFDCETDRADDCASEEHDLVEALQYLKSVDDVIEFRAYAVASCGKSGVSCNGAGTCTATDNVGCACMNNGVLTDASSCKQLAD